MNHQDQNRPLDEAVKKQDENVSLDSAKVESLLARQSQAMAAQQEKLQTIKDNQKRGLFSFRSGALSSAAALVLLSTLFFFWNGGFRNNESPDYSYEIAQEAVKNHLKYMPLDVQTASIDEAKRYFTRLDFAPVSSSLAMSSLVTGTNLLGGRYCSIKGETAAQLRYQLEPDSSNPVSTVFQVPYDQALHGELPTGSDAQPKTLQIKGLDVSLWVEKDLLMVLIQEA